MLFSWLRKRERKEPALDYPRAVEICTEVRRIREGFARSLDSDGNIVIVKYSGDIVETAARAASLAPDLPASIDEIERIFVAAEERISSGVYIS